MLRRRANHFTSLFCPPKCIIKFDSGYSSFTVGHLKRFMRGIAELVDVTKSAPPTPSPIPRLQHVNGHAMPPSDGIIPPFPEDNKTPEPQDDDKTIIAPPMGFDEADMLNQLSKKMQPPVASKPKRFSQDEALLNSDPSRPRAHSGEREGSVTSDGGGSFNRMRQLLGHKIGSGQSTESLENSVGSESSDPVKPSSRSPSHSPRIPRKSNKVSFVFVFVFLYKAIVSSKFAATVYSSSVISTYYVLLMYWYTSVYPKTL